MKASFGPPRVMALVLTFDAPDHLLACLRGIQSQKVQPDKILVVDNASRVPARDVVEAAGLATETTEFLRLPENLGPAGGYAAGLRRLAASDHDAAWVMDGDCVPDPDCLSALMSKFSSLKDPALIFPTVHSPNGNTTTYPAWDGVVIPTQIVERVGVPNEELFWWAEDSEYLQWRIPRAGYSVVRVPGAVVTHYSLRPRRRASWKYYYETRNFIYYLVHVQGRRELRPLLIPLVRTLVRILVIEDRRARKLRLFVRGYRDGMAGRLGRPLPVRSREEPMYPLAPRES